MPLPDRRRRPSVVGGSSGRRGPPEVRPKGGAIQYAYYSGSLWTGIEFFVTERTFAGVFPRTKGHVSGSALPPSTPE